MTGSDLATAVAVGNIAMAKGTAIDSARAIMLMASTAVIRP